MAEKAKFQSKQGIFCLSLFRIGQLERDGNNRRFDLLIGQPPEKSDSMIRHIWSVLCQKISTDAETNVVSLFSIYESIGTNEEPTAEKPVLLPLELITLWAREDVNVPCVGEMRMYYLGPNGVRAPDVVLEIDLKRTFFHRSVLRTPGLPISGSGVFDFCVEYREGKEDDWKVAAKIPLLVSVGAPQVAQQGSSNGEA